MKNYNSENGIQRNGPIGAKLNGNFSDYVKAMDHAKNKQWYESLKIWNELFSLPSDVDESIRHLNSLLQDNEPFKFNKNSVVYNPSPEPPPSELNAHFGRDIVFEIMEIRGRCYVEIFETISDLSRRGKDLSSEFFSSSDEGIQFMDDAIFHASLSVQLFWDSKFIVAFAGGIFYRSNNLEPAVACMKRALEIDPNYEYAAKILTLAEQQISDISK